MIEQQSYDEIQKGNKVLKIFIDDDPINPRENDNLTKLVLKHNRYNFENDLNVNFDNFENFDSVEDFLNEKYDILFIRSVYLYDHSGLSISLNKFSCTWDSGQIGFICILKSDIIKEYGILNDENINKALEVLKGEFSDYKDYIEGNVYGFCLYEKLNCKITKEYENGKKEIITTIENDLLDSCFGYFGDDGLKQLKEENGF